MRSRLVVLFLLFFSFAMDSSTAFGLDFAEFGALSPSFPSLQTNGDPTAGASIGLGYGGGVSFEAPIYKKINLEVAVMYMNRSFSAQNGSTPSAYYSLKTYQFPVLLRYWFTRKISAGIGGYFIYGLGNLVSYQGSSSQILGYSDKNWTSNDAGIVLSFKYKTPINEVLQFIIDERLLLGLNNIDTSGNGTFRMNEMQTFAGISFNF